MKYLIIFLSLILIISGCNFGNGQKGSTAGTDSSGIKPHDSAKISMLKYPQEKHFKNVRQLTFGGDNAEAYWSNDGKKLVFQARNEKWSAKCDQIFYFVVANAHLDSIPPK